MLYRKIEKEIKEHLENNANTILIVEGARQVGKSFIIRKVAQELFKNYIFLLICFYNHKCIFDRIIINASI